MPPKGSLFIMSAALLLAPSALAQSRSMTEPPRTVEGYPDFHGIWSIASVTTLERTPLTDKLVLTPEEAARAERNSRFVANATRQEAEEVGAESELPPTGEANAFGADGTDSYDSFWLDPGEHFAVVKGEIRSSWITEPSDGQIPYKSGVNTRTAAGSRSQEFDGPETRPIGDRCLAWVPNGPVMTNRAYNNNIRFIQSPGFVVILPEMMMQPRIIPIVSGPNMVKHLPKAISPDFGDSVGWYEGDTLVVETVNPSPNQIYRLLSANGKMIERFSRWSEDQILYEFAINDPDLFTQPWKGEISMNRVDQLIYEYACHEGNYSMPNILRGARIKEQRAAKLASAKGAAAKSARN